MAAGPLSTGATAGNVPSAGSAPATGAVLPTVSNFQQTAGQNIGNAGATALAQIAAAGSKGQAAIQQAQTQNAAAKTAAIQSIMGQQALRGAPIGNIQANEQTGVAPLVSRAQDLSAMGANYEANNQGLAAANANYFAGLQGALPIDQAAISQDILNDQSKNASAATAANLSLATKELALQAAQAKAGNSLGVGGGLTTAMTDQQKIDALGGSQVAGQLFNQQAAQAEGAGPRAGQMGAPLADLGAAQTQGNSALPYGTSVSPQEQAAAYGAIDQKYGLTPGTSQALAGQSEQAAQTKAIAAQGKVNVGPAQPKAPSTGSGSLITNAQALSTGQYKTPSGAQGTPLNQNQLAAWIEGQPGPNGKAYTPQQALSLAKSIIAGNPTTP